MPRCAAIALHWDAIAGSDACVVLCEPNRLVWSRLASVQGGEERSRDALDGVHRNTSKGMRDIIGMLMSSFEEM